SPNALCESSNGLNLAQSSSVLSLEGKDQVGNEREQTARRQIVSRRTTISPNDSKREDAEDKIIGSLWVQLERVNPRPSPTHSARESDWAKVKAGSNCGLSVFERKRFDS
ncbi:hypothetical protein H5410_031187, partial [Solanum commersonii]